MSGARKGSSDSAWHLGASPTRTSQVGEPRLGRPVVAVLMPRREP